MEFVFKSFLKACFFVFIIQAHRVLCSCTYSNGVTKLNIAVIGGGSAGSMTALELMNRTEVASVTIFEAGPEIGHIKSASGIIAATLMFNTFDQFFRKTDTGSKLDKWEDIEHAHNLYENAVTMSSRFLNFMAMIAQGKRKKDERMNKAKQRKFFERSAAKLKQIVDDHPTLCAGVISPVCCRYGSPARAWTVANQARVKVPCEGPGSHRGMLHAWLTQDHWTKRANFPGKYKGKYDLCPAMNLSSMASGILKSDAKTAAGGLWNGDRSGFVRVEDLFVSLRAIFESSDKVTMATKLFVESISLLNDNRLQVNCGASSDPTMKVLHCGKSYDKVIVANGAASVPLLDPTYAVTPGGEVIDEQIAAQLIPVKGYAIATDVKHVPDDQLGVGVQIQEHNHFIRAQSNGGIRYGFGYVIDRDHFKHELLDPKGDDGRWSDEAYADNTAIGREMLSSSKTLKLAGMRPVSYLNNFPLIKSYPGSWSNMVLNTGLGWHGYVLTWWASELTADLAIKCSLSSEWAFASEEAKECSVCFTTAQWVGIAVGIFCGIVILLVLIVGMCRKMMGKTFCCCSTKKNKVHDSDAAELA